ncbi:uncharacterized protein LOC130998020 [Salvia miltiorrhiza]|uniref:uncharacterized protein LOC130998020 n=1 Tax=Salvia miltiorrhiza TaxID=226208 RepID=UPI0025AD1746|nr:uncharacterized protein LOC130998020 [Salvia miltiorrhiza]
MYWNKLLKWHVLRGPLVRRVVLTAFVLVLLLILLCVLQMGREVRVISNGDGCNLAGLPLFGASPAPSSCEERENLTKSAFQELMANNFLQSDATVLCVGERSAAAALALRHLGFFNAFAAERRPLFSLLKRRFAYVLDFADHRFDFVFSEDLDRILVLEMERVLRPGGTGSVLIARGAHSAAALLKSSDVVRVFGVGASTMVVFKKRLDSSFASFDHFQLPTTCPCVENNKPFMNHIEPLTGRNSGKIAYLPDSMNISSRNRLIYINLGAGEYARSSIAKMSEAYCSGHHAAFEVYIIDHKTSVLSSFVMDSSINFVYHPGLAGDDYVTAAPDIISSDEFLTAPVEEQGFDFVPWFKETVSDGDFVVLMMKANVVELNILVELFESGAVCHVDEVFLRCSDAADCAGTACRDCVNLLESLRKSGVYAHRWLGD